MEASFFKQALFSLLLLIPFSIQAQQDSWQRADAPLMSRWAEEVGPENAHPEYPRPMMQRDNWQNLNGLWNFKMTRKGNDDGEYRGHYET